MCGDSPDGPGAPAGPSGPHATWPRLQRQGGLQLASQAQWTHRTHPLRSGGHMQSELTAVEFWGYWAVC